MALNTLDFSVIGFFFVIVLFIGFWFAKSAGKSKLEFFLAGRSLPWWVLGVSMVATTFSADTPNLVTGFVRENGIAKNWAWWSFLITGMVTVFIYARLWRKSGVLTDLEFYELRYGGEKAAFLRGFRALYLGVFFNCLIMGSVTMAAIKIANILFGMSPEQTVLITSVVVVIYSAVGGIKGVIWTDFFQFGVSMIGAVYAAVVAVNHPKVGGLGQLLSHPNVADKLDFFPDVSNPSVLVSLFIIPIAVQWWSVWYPGGEPGGGGYIAQRMLAAKNEKHALWATFFFNFAHYAVRPWAWILVALASLVLFPNLGAIQTVFTDIPSQYLGNDIAYPVMLTLLQPGWLGLVVASLIAAFLSTISTHLNWGSSYVVNDFYQRFIKPTASEKELVLVGRLSTVILMIISGVFALTIMENSSQTFDILLLSGAGTGAVFLFRWFWWRINAMTEIVAMVVATINAFVLVFAFEKGSLATGLFDHFSMQLIITTVITTLAWVLTSLFTRPESEDVKQQFYQKINGSSESGRVGINLKMAVLKVFLGCISIYSLLFSVGSFLYGEIMQGFILLSVSIVCVFILFRKLSDS